MKKIHLLKTYAVIFLISMVHFGYAQTLRENEKSYIPKPVAWWNFDSCNSRLINDEVSIVRDSVQGNFRLVNGISGKALKLDGFSTRIARKAGKVSRLGVSFTFEAWIAAATYPWNWVPILAQEKNQKKGFYFGVGPQGQIGISGSIDGAWKSCESEEKIALKEWTHVAAVYDSKRGFMVYINGKLSGKLDFQGKLVDAAERDLLIGMNSEKVLPSNPVRTYGTLPSWFSFDGIYDEIRIYDQALNQKSILELAKKTGQLLPPRYTCKGNAGWPERQRQVWRLLYQTEILR